ncbi:hypothetical protein [Desulfurobacterium sp.]
MRRKAALLIACLTFLLYSTTALSETGWLRKKRKGFVYFKPFVTVNEQNVLVIFVTPEGNVYRGTCKQKHPTKTCRILPGKRFASPYTDLRYIVLKISPPEAPEILKTGTVEKTVKEE